MRKFLGIKMPRSPQEIDDAFKQIQEKVFKLIDQWVEDALESIINNKPVQKRGLWDRFKGGLSNMWYGRQNEKNPYYNLNRFGDQLGAQESVQKRLDLKTYLELRECIESTELTLTEALDPNLEKLNIVKTIRQEAEKLKKNLEIVFKKIALNEKRGKKTPPPTASSSSSVALPASSSSSVALPASSSSSVAPPPSSSSAKPASSSSSSVAPPPSSSSAKPASSSSSSVAPPPSSSSGQKKQTQRTRTVKPTATKSSSSSSLVASSSNESVEENLILSKVYAKQDSQDDLRKQLSQGGLSKDYLLNLDSVIDNLENELVGPLYNKLEEEGNDKGKNAIKTWWDDEFMPKLVNYKEEDALEDIVTRLTTGEVLTKLIKLSNDPKITKKDLIEIIKMKK